MNNKLIQFNKKQEILDQIGSDERTLKAEIKLIKECPAVMKKELLKYFNKKYSFKERNLEGVISKLEIEIRELEKTKERIGKFEDLSQKMHERKNGGPVQ